MPLPPLPVPPGCGRRSTVTEAVPLRRCSHSRRTRGSPSRSRAERAEPFLAVTNTSIQPHSTAGLAQAWQPPATKWPKAATSSWGAGRKRGMLSR